MRFVKPFIRWHWIKGSPWSRQGNRIKRQQKQCRLSGRTVQCRRLPPPFPDRCLLALWLSRSPPSELEALVVLSAGERVAWSLSRTVSPLARSVVERLPDERRKH